MTARRHNIIVPVEGFAGSSIRDIGRDMIDLSVKLDAPVSCGVNGTRLLAFPTSTMKELQADYERQLHASDPA